MNITNLLKKNKLTISFLALSIVISIILIGCLIAPNIFYDQWIWKYYWGPIVSDAAGHSVSYNGVYANEGYTIISEITYGIILVIALYAIYNLLKKLKIIIDWKFCLALLPYILFGPVTRVLEDADFFNIPTVYVFISPLIYFQIAFYAISFILIGYYFNKISSKIKDKYFILSIIILFLTINLFVTIFWILGSTFEFFLFETLLLYLISCLSLAPLAYLYLKRKQITVNIVLFCGGLLFLFPSLSLISRWILGYQWSYSQGIRFDLFLLIFGLVLTILAIVYIISKKYENNEKLAVYQNPLNLLMISGHMIDGLTSYISIYDPLHMGLPLYLEKHPASNALMEIWPPLFPIVKFILIIAVIYLFDIVYKQDLKNYMTFTNLLKIGILILGLSPGLRDLLRVTMGV